MNTAFVLTTINSPNQAMQEFAQGCRAVGWMVYVAGDRKTPAGFRLQHAHYIGLDADRLNVFAYAARCHENTYARKNLGYLEAIKGGADIIVESDDDNLPYAQFFRTRTATVAGHRLDANGWANVYRYFTDRLIWPRGLPLDEVSRSQLLPDRAALPLENAYSPIQQALADLNPDVDAIFRLLFPGEVRFQQNAPVVLEPGTWCPFNSQNTTWWREAFPLLYLPTHCSFRMTDIWRGLVAQRIGWEYGWRISYHSPTVWQERNAHDLNRDFKDEVPGYLFNKDIAGVLGGIDMLPTPHHIGTNLQLAYEALIRHGYVGPEEMPMLESWMEDIHLLSAGKPECREGLA